MFGLDPFAANPYAAEADATASPRSLFAFWIGGAGVAPTTEAGVRSMLAPWMGGAGSESAPATQGGARGLMAFWMGGAASGSAGPPTPPPFQGFGVGPRRRDYSDDKRLREIEEEDTMLLILGALAARSGLLQ